MEKTFHYRPEAGLSPYIGLTSFQHFNGEKLYSDVIVDPNGGMLETENLECYPVPEDVPEDGRAQGYYPPSTVVYIRMLWKEFEPHQGDYRYEVIRDVLDEAERHRQTVMFRLIAHSTRARDDVPDWVREIVDCPERPDGMRNKMSPTDPRFWELFGNAVRRIGERFDRDPRLDAVDISLPGAWGEGHKLELFSEDILERLIDDYLAAFHETHLISQICSPAMVNYIVNSGRAVGWRGDGVGTPYHINEFYPQQFARMPKDLWKTAPVSFEAYWWLGEWQRQGWSLDEMAEVLLNWHLSTFNAKSLPIPWDWQEKTDEFVRKMGYHYTIDRASFPERCAAGQVFSLTVDIENVGVAPIYRPLPLTVRLIGDGTTVETIAAVDIRQWLPGKHTFSASIPLPADAHGICDVEIGILAPDGTQVYFATDAAPDGAFYRLGTVEIG